MKVFCFCPELLTETEGGHVSRAKQEELPTVMSFAFLLMRSSSYFLKYTLHKLRTQYSMQKFAKDLVNNTLALLKITPSSG